MTIRHFFQRATWGAITGLLIALVSFPGTARADFFMDPCWGGVYCQPLTNLTLRFNVAFFGHAGYFALAIFLVGAFIMTISAGKDTLYQRGRQIMIGSAIGLAVIVGSYGMYRTIIFLLYS